ncbi:DUF3325 domain-containing protein [Acidovorax sp. SUPP2522]|nr:DUF3325 domain-containing protein [Acidovorax sp. SUPP2522]
MDRHHQDAWNREGAEPQLRTLRRVGWALLVLSLVHAAAWPGDSTAALSVTWWAIALSLSAVCATALATWLPRRLPVLGTVAAAAALLALAL